ncbi:MAG TPA: hypothetical protein PKB14_23820 [Rubrivivax sp.]|nr:hypothetical protein [Rubrivivax sp.]
MSDRLPKHLDERRMRPGNRIAHGYDTVDDAIVFETVTTRFAALLDGLDRELRRPWGDTSR